MIKEAYRVQRATPSGEQQTEDKKVPMKNIQPLHEYIRATLRDDHTKNDHSYLEIYEYVLRNHQELPDAHVRTFDKIDDSYRVIVTSRNVDHTLHITQDEIEADLKARGYNSHDPSQGKPFDKGIDAEKMERSFRNSSPGKGRDIDNDRER
jgi:hypothetical protein